jgi:hypothetical protein
VLSYAGGLYFGFTACHDRVPSVQRLAVYTGEALDELEATYMPKAKSKARVKAKAKARATPRKPARKAAAKKAK